MKFLSRSRSRSITSHKLFPSATLLVPASEAEHYRHTGLEIETISDEIAGISAVRNWVLRHFTEDAIGMLDDDISACVCMVSLRCRKSYSTTSAFRRALEDRLNAASKAEGVDLQR